MRISRAGPPPPISGRPLVLFTNHASWWDPLVGLVIKSECFGGRSLFAPIDAATLQRYRMFARLGFFGVEQGSRGGAAQFLRVSEAILKNPASLLAVTPQGRFADVRERPVKLTPGLGHLASRVEDVDFLPVATEYVFWEERLPEILVRFGEPIRTASGVADARQWTARFEESMTATQDALAVEARQRNPAEFKTILSGAAGQGGIYDFWRALKARLWGEKFRKEHGTV